MKDNKGSAKLGLAIFGGLLAMFIFLGILVGLGAMGFYNSAVSMETGIKAQFEQNKNNYSSYFNKLKEVAQVPEMYTNDLKKVYDSALSSRYGAEGSKAALQFIKEMNPNFDSSLYKQIMQIIESGRNSFEADQKTLIDKKQVYETTLQTFPNNMLAGMFGFPRIKLEDYKIVVSTGVQEVFEKGEAGPIDLKR